MTRWWLSMMILPSSSKNLLRRTNAISRKANAHSKNKTKTLGQLKSGKWAKACLQMASIWDKLKESISHCKQGQRTFTWISLFAYLMPSYRLLDRPLRPIVTTLGVQNDQIRVIPFNRYCFTLSLVNSLTKKNYKKRSSVYRPKSSHIAANCCSEMTLVERHWATH